MKVRDKYPQYKDIGDNDLANSLSLKYPQYRESLANDAAASSGRLKLNNQLEDQLGGKLVDPETGDLAYSDEKRKEDTITAKLAELEGRQRSLARENEIIDERGQAGKIESVGAGSASVPAGIVSLGSLALQRTLERVSGKPVPEGLKPLIGEELTKTMEEVIGDKAGANPISGGVGAIGTNLLTMGGAGGTGKLLSEGAFKAAGKEFGKNAGINVAAGEGLRTLTGGETTAKDVLIDAGFGLAGGRNRGREQQAVSMAEKAFGSGKDAIESGTERLRKMSPRFLENRRINIDAKKAQEASQIALLDAAEGKTMGGPSTITPAAVNTPKARQAAQRFLSTGKDPGEAVQLQRDANLAINSTKEELGLTERMIKEGEEYATDFDKRNPLLTVGEEFLRRTAPFKELRSQYGKELAQSVKDIPGDALVTKFEDVVTQGPEGPITQRIVKNPGVDPREAVLKRMSAVGELEGLTMDRKGNLDFSNTSMRGERSSSMRKQIQNDFAEIVDATPMQIHKKRQELRDVIAKVDFKERGAYEKALEAIRQGSADVLEEVSPKYKELNKKVATLIEPADELARYLKLADEANVPVNFLEEEAGIIARRLTSNAPSNPKIGALIDQIEKRLGEEGIKFDTRMSRVQQMYNMVNRHFPEITAETSIKGQVGNNLPTSKSDVVNKAIGAVTKDLSMSPAVRKQYLKDLIKSLK